MFTQILVGLDGSPGSLRALEAAVAVAQKFGGTLHALTVVEPLPRFAATVGEVEETREAEETEVARIQQEAGKIAADQGVALETGTAYGHPAQVLAEQTKSGAYDLVVVGHSGQSRVWGPFLGATSDKLSHHAACSILIVR
jgi:nucleotide-binding universal stress UspA family protein